jgi:hypothetical protein
MALLDGRLVLVLDGLRRESPMPTLKAHPDAVEPVRPKNEEFDRNVREAMRDSANAISVAWLASECRRARFQETELLQELARLKSG